MKIKGLSAILLFISLLSCSVDSPVNTPQSENDTFYTQALTENYLKKKITALVNGNEGNKLVKEINFAKYKHPALIAAVIKNADSPTDFYDQIINTDEVSTKRSTDSVFNSFVTGLNPNLVNKIVFTSQRDGNDEIYTMDTDGSNPVRLTTNTKAEYDPSWSPDNSKILFTSYRDNNAEIYVMDADGSNQTRLTTNSAGDYHPVWSPDGSKIIFVSNRGGSYRIYAMDAIGGNPVAIAGQLGNNYYPRWSPDGTKIAFASDRNGSGLWWDLYVMDINGSNVSRLTTTYRGGPFMANWSPNGSKIVFTHNTSLDTGINLINSDGTELVKITTVSANYYYPDWSSDGTKIIYGSNRNSNTDIYVINIDGSNEVRLTNHGAVDNYPNWSN